MKGTKETKSCHCKSSIIMRGEQRDVLLSNSFYLYVLLQKLIMQWRLKSYVELCSDRFFRIGSALDFVWRGYGEYQSNA